MSRMRRVARSGRKRRALDWICTSELTTVVDNSVAVTTPNGAALIVPLLNGQDMADQTAGGCTVVRVVGDFIISNVVNSAGAETAGGFVTCITVMQPTISGGVENVLDEEFGPALVDDSHLWYRMSHVGSTVAGASGVDMVGTTNQALLPTGAHIDVSVNRKMKQGESLLALRVFPFSIGFGGWSSSIGLWNYTYSLRVLVKQVA